jgi:GT2 family glycosyltransferase
MLRLCLAALMRQTHPPIEVCVGRRVNDAEPAAVLAEFAERSGGVVREAVVPADGNLVASMNAALALTTGDLVALTDDDAEAPPDWLQRLATYFDDPTVGGAGGRDDQPVERWEEPEVGVRKWWGKVVGNHHLGAGPPRDVDLLKGVNCCFRGAWLRGVGFERSLRGAGNVSNWEMFLCFRLRHEGQRLVYDPALRLDHHIGPRHDGDVNARGGFERASFIDGVHNGCLSLLCFSSSPRRAAYRVWRLFVGTRAEPGLLQVARLVAQGVPAGDALERFFATREGIAEAERTYAAVRRTPTSQTLRDDAPAAAFEVRTPVR